MTTHNELLNARLTVYTINPDIFISSRNKKDDYFYVVVNQKIVVHIYLRKKQWYIWYCKKAYRTTVKSFTDACLQIETEIMNCVA